MTTDAARNEIDIGKIRADIAWKSFEHYAKQRVTMFHFYILLIATLLGGYALTLKEVGTLPAHLAAHEWFFPLAIACFGTFVSIIFFGLDRRNQYLYRTAEYNLVIFEEQFLYAHAPFMKVRDIECVSSSLGRNYVGLFAESVRNEDGLIKKYSARSKFPQKLIRYQFLMAVFYSVTTSGFAYLALVSFCHSHRCVLCVLTPF